MTRSSCKLSSRGGSVSAWLCGRRRSRAVHVARLSTPVGRRNFTLGGEALPRSLPRSRRPNHRPPEGDPCVTAVTRDVLARRRSAALWNAGGVGARVEDLRRAVARVLPRDDHPP